MATPQGHGVRLRSVSRSAGGAGLGVQRTLYARKKEKNNSKNTLSTLTLFFETQQR